MSKYMIREITVVSGFAVDGPGSAEMRFDGHMEFGDALQLAGGKIQTHSGKVIHVRHDLEVLGLASWRGTDTRFAIQADGDRNEARTPPN